TISNQKTYTTWMKLVLLLRRSNQDDVLSMPKSMNDFKRNRGDKSGYQWWNMFVPIEVLFHLWLFSKLRIFQQNGFLRAFIVTRGFPVIRKVGQAIDKQEKHQCI